MCWGVLPKPGYVTKQAVALRLLIIDPLFNYIGVTDTVKNMPLAFYAE